MKKSIWFFLLILIDGLSFAQVSGNINTPAKDTLNAAQEFQKKHASFGRVTLGIKAGYNQSNIYGNEIAYIFSDSKTQWLQGFHAGLMVNTQWNSYFWLKHELLFSTRGALVTLSDNLNSCYASKLRTYYVDLMPLSPCFHLSGMQIYAGPYVSVLTDAFIQRKNESGAYVNDHSVFGTPDNRESENENKYLQKFDFGFNIGVEYQFKFGLLLGAKYIHGYTDLFQYANSYVNNDSKVDKIKIFNQSILISLGYSFVKNKK